MCSYLLISVVITLFVAYCVHQLVKVFTSKEIISKPCNENKRHVNHVENAYNAKHANNVEQVNHAKHVNHAEDANLFQLSRPESYSMSRPKKGTVVTINNLDNEMEATKKDVWNISDTFTSIGFDVEKASINLKHFQMKEIIDSLRLVVPHSVSTCVNWRQSYII